jgi:hypothetical protein
MWRIFISGLQASGNCGFVCGMETASNYVKSLDNYGLKYAMSFSTPTTTSATVSSLRRKNMVATTEFLNRMLKWGLLLCELWRRVVLYLFTKLRGVTSQYDSNIHSHRCSNLTSQLNHYTQQRVLEKLTVPQLGKKFLTFYGIRKFLSLFKTALQFCLR